MYNETLRYFPRSTSPATTSVNECMQKEMYKLFDSDECVKNCPVMHWANTDTGLCQPCTAVCATCFGSSSDNCLSCLSGLFYEYECLSKCPDGYFKDDDLKECLPCSSKCRSCDPSSGHCTQCREGLSLDPTLGQCIPVLNQSPNSTECHEGCKICKGQMRNDCLLCSSDLKLLNGVCIDESCPDGFYLKETECSS